MTATNAPELLPEQKHFMKTILKPSAQRAFFLFKLPSAWFWGFRIVSLDTQECKVKLRYRWRTKNPFRSVYFATQTGAAELSTGVLAMLALRGAGDFSVLVIRVESEFVKKASSTTFFTCPDGEKFFEAVRVAKATGEPQTVTAASTGITAEGEVVSRFLITWSFKAKVKKA